MSGHDTLRGIYLQVLSSLIEILNIPKLERIVLEPDNTSDKVDILVILKDKKKKAIQVKSSKNAISYNKAKQWANELKKSYKADFYELTLIGPIAQSLSYRFEIDGVRVPPPIALNIESMQGYACFLLLNFLNQESLVKINPDANSLNNLLSTLISEFFKETLKKNTITKIHFKEIIKRNFKEAPNFNNDNLIVTNVSIKKKGWIKYQNSESFFTESKITYFGGDGDFGVSKNLVFEIVIYNNTNQSLLISSVGFELYSFATLLYPKGVPHVALKKIPLSKYNFHINVVPLNEKELRKFKKVEISAENHGCDQEVISIYKDSKKEYNYQLRDPLEFNSKKFFRFKITLENYLENIPNNSLIRLFVNNGIEYCYSDYIHINSNI